VRVLALNAYHGGSHRAFLEGWAEASAHELRVLALPPRHWKWRMRHAAIHFAGEARRLIDAGERFDAVLCTDMLNLAEFRGLAPEPVRRLPAVAYFHENQLAYPTRVSGPERARDEHFALTNLTTALAADAAWFNSAFNRDSMLAGLDALLRRMPDFAPLGALGRVRARSRVEPPFIDDGLLDAPARPPEPGRTLRVLWAARWEHDKGPETFLEALRRLVARGVAFRVSMLGGGPGRDAERFDDARRALGDRVERWGYAEGAAAYRAALAAADVVVSTARHEFFGIAALEAVAAGALPLVPDALAYPETLGPVAPPECFHGGDAADVARRLEALADRVARTGHAWPEPGGPGAARAGLGRFRRSRRVPALDDALEDARALAS
jgi:glycosyltransferase involved in cell wall biosynthesis